MPSRTAAGGFLRRSGNGQAQNVITTQDLTHRTTQDLPRQTTLKPTRPPLAPSSARLTPSSCPILFLCSFPLHRKNFCRGHPQMPFPLLEFVSFGLSSVYKPKYLFPRDTRVYHAVQTDPPFRPGPLRRSRDFFARPRKSLVPRPPLRPRHPAFGPSFFSNSPDSLAFGDPFPQSAPFSRFSFATAPVLPAHDRLSPTRPAQNRCPFRPFPRPAPLLPPPLPRRRRGAPPRTGRPRRFAPRRSRFGLSIDRAEVFAGTRLP